MIINLETPVVRSAVAGKTFPDAWISNLSINLQPGTPGRAFVTWIPYDSATSAYHTTAIQNPIVIDDLMTKLAEDAAFQAAWEAVTTYLAGYMADLGIAEEP